MALLRQLEPSLGGSLIVLLTVPLLLPLDLLELVEFLPVQLVELAIDVLDSILGPGDDDVFDSVNSAIDDLDDVVEDDEGGLQAGEFDEGLDGLPVDVPSSRDLLSTPAQSHEREVFARSAIVALDGEGLERWQQHS